MKKEFANVIVDISHEKVDRPFGYRIPERLADSVTPGVRVKIPFGAGNALRTGYVIEVTDHSEFPRERMKEIDSVLPGTKEPSQRLIVLAAWMKQQYGSTMIQALKTVLPARATVGEKERKSIELLLQDAQTQELAAQMERKHQTARTPIVTGAYDEPDDFVGGSDQKVKSSVVCNQQAGIRRRFKSTCFCSIP